MGGKARREVEMLDGKGSKKYKMNELVVYPLFVSQVVFRKREC